MKRVFAAIGLAIFAAAASAQTAPSTADFVKMVAISDMFEVESSKLALEKKVAADQAFAQRMVHDHTQTTEQLKHLVHSDKVKEQHVDPEGEFPFLISDILVCVDRCRVDDRAAFFHFRHRGLRQVEHRMVEEDEL
jgi:hypothetical protein